MSSKLRVLFSQSTDVFTNLAFEELLLRQLGGSELHDTLLFYINSPSVVIGKFQNPWIEVNYRAALEDRVPIARRHSGGGTVYHDTGNLNCSLITPPARHRRKENLLAVAQVLQRSFALPIRVGPREELLADEERKVSGSAARITRRSAYHHFTLLLDASKDSMSRLLASTSVGIETNATRSQPMGVVNLRELDASIDAEKVVHAISAHWGSDGVEFVNPLECAEQKEFIEIFQEMQDWRFIYGRTPKFTIRCRDRLASSSESDEVLLSIEIDRGYIKSAKFSPLNGSTTLPLPWFAEMLSDEVAGCAFDLSAVELRLSSFSFSMGDVATKYVTMLKSAIKDAIGWT